MLPIVDGSAFGSVVAFAGQDFVVVIRDLNLDFPEFAVAGRVGRIVAECVLAAELFGDLIEGGHEVFFVVDDDHAAARFVGDFLGNAAVGAVARVIDEKDVDDGIGALGGLDGLFDAHFAAIVFGVG